MSEGSSNIRAKGAKKGKWLTQWNNQPTCANSPSQSTLGTGERLKRPILTVFRKNLILEHRHHERTEGTVGSQVAIGSDMWIHNLTQFMSHRDGEVTMDDVMRWCRNHPWITHPTNIPRGRGIMRHFPLTLRTTASPFTPSAPSAPSAPSGQQSSIQRKEAVPSETTQESSRCGGTGPPPLSIPPRESESAPAIANPSSTTASPPLILAQLVQFDREIPFVQVGEMWEESTAHTTTNLLDPLATETSSLSPNHIQSPGQTFPPSPHTFQGAFVDVGAFSSQQPMDHQEEEHISTTPTSPFQDGPSNGNMRGEGEEGGRFPPSGQSGGHVCGTHEALYSKQLQGRGRSETLQQFEELFSALHELSGACQKYPRLRPYFPTIVHMHKVMERNHKKHVVFVTHKEAFNRAIVRDNQGLANAHVVKRERFSRMVNSQETVPLFHLDTLHFPQQHQHQDNIEILSIN